MIKRKWSGAPAWADYLCQLSCWWDDRWDDLARFMSTAQWRWNFLEEHCNCEKCQARRKDDAA